MKFKSKNYMIWVIAGLVLLLFFIYRKNITFGNNETKQITIITKSKYGESWEEISAGIRAGANEFGVEVKMLAPDSDKDVEAQKILLETAAAGGTDAIIIAPINFKSIEETVEIIEKQGIPVITMLSYKEDSSISHYIGLDHYGIGQRLGEAVISEIGTKGNVAIMSIVESTDDHLLKEKGISDFLEQYPDIQILKTKGQALGEFSVTMQTIDLLTKQTDVNVVVGLDEGATRGISKAFDSLGLTTIVIGFGGSYELLNYVESGEINLLIVPNNFSIGYIAIKNTVAYIHHEKLDKTTYIDSKKIDLSNMHDEINQRIIFPIK